MIRDPQLPELEVFRKVEQKLPFSERFDYSKYVSPVPNSDVPVHRWFRFKESFSPDLLTEILHSIAASLGKHFRLLDPFCGVGTTLLAAQEKTIGGYDIEAIGIEANPFIEFAARTKVRWPEIDADALTDLAARILKKSDSYHQRIPPLSSLTTGRCISRHLSQRILAIREALRHDGDTAAHDALLLGLASAIEPASRIRKDGRALRIIEKDRPNLTTILKDRWAIIAEDVKFFQNTIPKPRIPRVMLGDGRKIIDQGFGADSFDLVLTSPPYPNNIDYSEVYKLELWLLGFLKTQDEFLKLRRTTFRSHPTCSTPEPLAEFVAELRKGRLKILLQPILERLEKIPGKWRERVLLGYFSDIWLSLHQQYQCLRKGGFAILVVGNSLHGGAFSPYLVPTDIVVSTIGSCLGFELVQLTIARASKRRLSGNHFLRESVVIFKKT